MTFIPYAVHKDGRIIACGSLLTCWQHLANGYPQMLTDPVDMAEAGIFISPVGDHHNLERTTNDQTATQTSPRA